MIRAGLIPVLPALDMSALLITVPDLSLLYGSRRGSGETLLIYITVNGNTLNFVPVFRKIRLTERGGPIYRVFCTLARPFGTVKYG